MKSELQSSSQGNRCDDIKGERVPGLVYTRKVGGLWECLPRVQCFRHIVRVGGIRLMMVNGHLSGRAEHMCNVMGKQDEMRVGPAHR